MGVYMRNALVETPEYTRVRERARHRKLPIKDVVTRHWGAVLLSTDAEAAERVPFSLFRTSVVAYARDCLGVRNNTVLLAVAAAALVATLWMPIFGRISDSFSREKMYRWSSLATVVLSVPYYLVLNTGETWAIFVATILGFGFLWGGVNAILGTLIAENFAPEIRYTGATLGYQLGAAIFGGTAPIIAASLFEMSDGQWWPIALYVALCCMISIIASMLIKRVPHTDIAQAPMEAAESQPSVVS